MFEQLRPHRRVLDVLGPYLHFQSQIFNPSQKFNRVLYIGEHTWGYVIRVIRPF